ncbi:MAG: TetR/AcrR family transcriptional regulator [Lachnospiraceae bacterium]|nr:TetR/AcrR family transcriptional regulator [Lachnospiraceae bacterium]
MPRKFMFTREEILAAALDLAREQGIAAVTARRLGEKLGSSSKPVFSLFENMEDVLSAVMEAAYGLYQNYLKEDMARGKYPPYKASGMAYIRFAKEEKELFKLLFMRDRSQESIEEKGENKPLIELVQQDLGISEEDARLFHLEMWIYVHGMATMLATSYLELDEGLISRVLTDGYEGMKVRYIGGGSI